MTPGGTERWSETSRYDERDCPSLRSRPARSLRPCGAAIAAQQCHTARIYHDGKADLFGDDPAGQVIAAAYGQAVSKVASALAESSSPPWHQTFSYDPAGNRTRASDSVDSEAVKQWEYATNEANQYIEISEKGQVKSEKGTANEPTAITPRYDQNGNLLNDERNTYTWDADIHLLSVSTRSADDSLAPSPTTHFRYDALHRRVARLEIKQGAGADGKWNAEHEQTLFIHDGWNVLQEVHTTVNRPLSTVTLIWGHDISGKPQGAGGIGGLIKSTQKVASASAESGSDPESSNLASCIFHYDSNGNVVLLTDSEGQEAARYAYDAFGKTLLATGPMAQDNKYRFSTKPVEETSGLSFYGYRYYAPQLGRWLSRDPLGDAEYANRLVGNRLNDIASRGSSAPNLGGLLAATGNRLNILGKPTFLTIFASNNPIGVYDVIGLVGCSDLADGANWIYEHFAVTPCEESASRTDCRDCCESNSEGQFWVNTGGFVCDAAVDLTLTATTGGAALPWMVADTIWGVFIWVTDNIDIAEELEECLEDCPQCTCQHCQNPYL